MLRQEATQITPPGQSPTDDQQPARHLRPTPAQRYPPTTQRAPPRTAHPTDDTPPPPPARTSRGKYRQHRGKAPHRSPGSAQPGPPPPPPRPVPPRPRLTPDPPPRRRDSPPLAQLPQPLPKLSQGRVPPRPPLPRDRRLIHLRRLIPLLVAEAIRRRRRVRQTGEPIRPPAHQRLIPDRHRGRRPINRMPTRPPHTDIPNRTRSTVHQQRQGCQISGELKGHHVPR